MKRVASRSLTVLLLWGSVVVGISGGFYLSSAVGVHGDPPVKKFTEEDLRNIREASRIMTQTNRKLDSLLALVSLAAQAPSVPQKTPRLLKDKVYLISEEGVKVLRAKEKRRDGHAASGGPGR